MTSPKIALLFVAFSLTPGCDRSVPLRYATKADAESERVFARGWLPEIIPNSSREIRMYHDLDLNTSIGEFRFEQSERSQFIKQLHRKSEHDVGASFAYTYSDGTFWLSDDSDLCRFNLGITQNNKANKTE